MSKSAIGARDSLNQDLYSSARFLVAMQPRGNHLCIVEHEQVAGRQNLRQVCKATISEAFAYVQQPGEHFPYIVGPGSVHRQNPVELLDRVKRLPRFAAGETRFCTAGTCSGGSSTPRSPRATITASDSSTMCLRRSTAAGGLEFLGGLVHQLVRPDHLVDRNAGY